MCGTCNSIQEEFYSCMCQAASNNLICYWQLQSDTGKKECHGINMLEESVQDDFVPSHTQRERKVTFRNRQKHMKRTNDTHHVDELLFMCNEYISHRII